MEKHFTLNILGSWWDVYIKSVEEEPRLKGISGFTDWTTREIVIGEVPEDTTLGAPKVFLKKILRHEIVHAFMYESGLGDVWDHDAYGQDETIVDWIALQLQKLAKTCRDAESELDILIYKESCIKMLEEKRKKSHDGD